MKENWELVQESSQGPLDLVSGLLFYSSRPAYVTGSNTSLITKRLRVTNPDGEDILLLGDDNTRLSLKHVTLAGRFEPVRLGWKLKLNLCSMPTPLVLVDDWTFHPEDVRVSIRVMWPTCDVTSWSFRWSFWFRTSLVTVYLGNFAKLVHIPKAKYIIICSLLSDLLLPTHQLILVGGK